MKVICTFQGIDALAVTTEENQPGSFHGDFHMEFCDNRKQLFQAYFRDFTIERLDNPWQAFTGGWHLEVSKLAAVKFEAHQLNFTYF